jgi:hypothetical protein
MISTGSISVLALIIQSLDLNTASVELMCTIIAGTDVLAAANNSTRTNGFKFDTEAPGEPREARPSG